MTAKKQIYLTALPLIILINTSLNANITVYVDADMDGYGGAGVGTIHNGTLAPIGFSTLPFDSFDNNANAANGLIDWNDGIDNDLDGIIDEEGIAFNPSTPTVALTPGATFSFGDNLQFDASGSSDPSGMHHYTWSINGIDRFITLNATINTAEIDYASFLTEGNHSLSVTAYNNFGVSDTANTSFNIIPEPSSALLFGLAALAFVTRRQRKV
ncbi:MAG: PEP-CTERM sorting domain-containing protein [Opitutaceae bacterium]